VERVRVMDTHPAPSAGLQQDDRRATRPTVYGYISLQHDDEDEITALHDQLTAYAKDEGLALAEIYVDRNVMPGQIIRPGLTVLLDAVVRTDGCGVLTPTANHLSSSQAVRRAIEMEIEILGGRLTVVESGSRTAHD